MIYKEIINNIKNHKKQLALLVDPDKHNDDSLVNIARNSELAKIDFLLIGGSLIFKPIDKVIEILKSNYRGPVILFPGSLLQLSDKADGILLLSLISGRNPELLIGNLVVAALFLKKSGLEIIPTGYMLIDGGRQTSVEYMSNTNPIPFDKKDIAIATAIAGEMLGLKMIYMDAGSGSQRIVYNEMISEVRNNIDIPLIVGGGIKNLQDLTDIYKAGADLVVISTAVEENPEMIFEFTSWLHK